MFKIMLYKIISKTFTNIPDIVIGQVTDVEGPLPLASHLTVYPLILNVGVNDITETIGPALAVILAVKLLLMVLMDRASPNCWFISYVIALPTRLLLVSNTSHLKESTAPVVSTLHS